MARLAWIVICLCCSLLSLCRSEDPPGHMQPLGSHMEPKMVDRIVHVPSPEEFYREYVQPKKPVVFGGVLKRTDVLWNWQRDEYLREHFGNDVVNIEEGKKENRSAFAKFLSMADFLDRYKEDDIYMVTDLPEGMLKEWMVPRFMLCGGYTNNLMYVYMWFSSGGTKSVLHTDSYENMHCLVSGRKEFVLIEPQYSTVIGPEHSALGYYYIDVDRVNMTAYPNLTSVPWYKVVVEEGDCLYLPYSWIHHVHSYGRNLGVNIWWIPFEFNAEDCSGDIPEFASLANFRITPELQLKNVLKEEEQEDGMVSAEDILRMMNKHPNLAGITLDTIKKMFELLDPGCEGVIPTSKLDSIPLDRYREAFQYITSVGESLDMPGMEAGEEGGIPPHPHESDVETEFTDFGEEGIESYGNYDRETEEQSGGPIPPSQQKEEL